MAKQNNILAIVGPKGGVGKTTISANLAIALSKMGKTVTAVDLDFGAANLHTIFGLKEPKYTLNDFILNKVKKLSNIVLDTSLSNLRIACGGDIPGIANLHYQKKLKLIRNLSDLESDLVLLDLAAGSSTNVVDFLIIAQNGLLITTPEVPSLLNTYSFIKTLIFRRLKLYFKSEHHLEVLELLEKAKNIDDNPDLKTMEGFLSEAHKINGAAVDAAKSILQHFKPILVVNRVRTDSDVNAGEVIRKLMKQYLSIESSVIMIVREDREVGNAIARMKPVMLEAPASMFSKDVEQIAIKIFESNT
jgi:flagellar biosynthesis protein FlhG